MKKRNVKYIFSNELIKYSNQNPAVKNRASLVHELIKSYKLLNHMEIVPYKMCDYSDLRTFHSNDYLEVLNRLSSLDSDEEEDNLSEDSPIEEYGLGYDCPVWNGVFDYACAIAGTTISACDEICKGADVVINWYGGWHHAHRDKAAGYCYVNDIVLGILHLRRQFDRILYIDLDVHHGDGVEEAFESTKRVFTLSFHQLEPGFFPGTGGSTECGFGTAKGYAANLPYRSGISGDVFKQYFTRITTSIIGRYQPQVCVIQCGADVISGDPLGGTNLIPEDLIDCVSMVLEKNLPTILLGGGGYHFTNTSRYWTMLTSMVCGQHLDEDIPDENELFLKYGPDYSLKVNRTQIIDENTTESLKAFVDDIEDNLNKFNVHQV